MMPKKVLNTVFKYLPKNYLNKSCRSHFISACLQALDYLLKDIFISTFYCNLSQLFQFWFICFFSFFIRKNAQTSEILKFPKWPPCESVKLTEISKLLLSIPIKNYVGKANKGNKENLVRWN